MDVYDAGVFVYRFEAAVPQRMRTVLWGPLHAKELGLPGWEVQDGGETGFVYHKRTSAGRMGTMLASIIVTNRARRATLSVTLAGYDTNIPEGERNLEVLSLVTEAEVFLTRLAGDTVRFQRTVGITLVDQNHPQEEILDRRDVAPLPEGKTQASSTRRRIPRRLGGGSDETGDSTLWDVS